MRETETLWASLYLQDDDGDDGHLRAEPGEEPLQLTTLANQVTVHNDGNQAHGFHYRLQTDWKKETVRAEIWQFGCEKVHWRYK